MPTIIWAPNPLRTAVHLNDNEREIVLQKLRVESLELRIVRAFLDLDPQYREQRAAQGEPKTIEESVAMALRCLDYGSLYSEERRAEDEKQRDEYVTELLGVHDGDCICIPCSCLKCHAEEMAGVDTIRGLGKHEAGKIGGAFKALANDDVAAMDMVLESLRTYEPKMREGWPGGEEDFRQHVPRWRAEAKRAYEWLLAYKQEHFA